jgi:glutathione S-transferase
MFLRGREVEVELMNTSDREHAQALMAGGGKTQVPCLRIEHANGDVEWMYESDDIIRYLS